MNEPAHEPATPLDVDSPAMATADDDLLAVLADEYAARLRRGEDPRVEEYVAAHPVLAERIRKVFEAVCLMEQSRTIDLAGAAERVGATIGRYKLLERIGEGGFGVVYMAEQLTPVRRKVALKVLKPGMDTRQVLARFEAERQALAIMDHPNIAKVFDAGATDSGRPYFVMELIKGVPLTEYCDQRQLAPHDRLDLFAHVCHAVQHAHQKGIIHRDIKPTNVLAALHDTTPVVKVIDFGVAKALGQELTDKTLFTGFAQLLGTPLYMSPEQAGQSALDIDTRSDIYSLGVLLYELLTGTTPFDKERFRKAAHDEICRIIREEEPPRPSTRLSESKDSLPSISALRHTEPAKLTKLVRGELDWIVMKALEKDRTRRYETASGMARDIERYLLDEPVEACPPSNYYRLKKFVRRNAGTLATASIISLAVLFAAGSFAWAVRDRTVRQANVAGQVDFILSEVAQLEGEQKWPEALLAARRADAVVTGGQADVETSQRVRKLLTNLEFIDRLEQIRMQRATAVDGAELDEDFSRAFRDFGVDVDKWKVERSIDRLRSHPALTIPLAEALDDWNVVRTTLENVAGSKRLLEVARGIDPHPLRGRLRELCFQPGSETRDELRRLAETIDVRAHRRLTLVILAYSLQDAELQEYALRILRDAQQIYPGDYHVNFNLAFALHSQYDYEGAVRFYTAAVSIRPYSYSAHYNLGFSLRYQKKLDEAIAAFRKAIELHPADASAHSHLGRALGDQGKSDEAVAVFSKAIELFPNHYGLQFDLGHILRDQGKLDAANAAIAEAIQGARHAVEREPKNATVHYFMLAVYLQQEGKFDEAIDAYRKAIEADPIKHGNRNNLGNLLRQQGKLEEALAVFREAIEVHATDAGAYNGLGLILREQGKLDEAIDAFRRSIEIKQDAGTFINLGSAFSLQKKPDEEVDAYRKAIEVQPTFSFGHFALGEGLREQKKLDEAVLALRKSIELDPGLGHAHFSLGKALYDQNKLGESFEAFKKANEVDPNALASVQARIALMKKDPDFDEVRDREDFKRLNAAIETRRSPNDVAWELATSPDPSGRDPSRAVVLAEKAVAEAPSNADFWNTLGVARYRAGDFEGAIVALQKYRELRKGDAEWSNPFFLAMAHWQLGKKDEARRWYETAVNWMDSKASTSENLIRFRAEAAELMGVNEEKESEPSSAPPSEDH